MVDGAVLGGPVVVALVVVVTVVEVVVVEVVVIGGAVVGAVGVSLLRSSVAGLLITAALGVLFWFKSSFEERLLVDAYPGYKDYRQRVRNRLIPWVV